MGLLRVDRTGQVYTLSDRTRIGRGADCAIVLDEGRVSSEHAVLLWRDGWWLRDLASRNGTTLQGEPVQPGVDRPLAKGAQLAFALVSCTLVEPSPPTPAARDLSTGLLFTAPAEVLGLPEHAPVASVLPGPRGEWRLELEHDESLVGDQQEIEVLGRRYRLHLPTLASDPPACDVSLSFALSPDGRVSVTLADATRRVPLPPGLPSLLLLALARARLSSRAHGLEQGWVSRETLASALRCSPRAVNLHLHRLRQDIARHALPGSSALLEARTHTGQIRLATGALEILPEVVLT